MLLPVIEGMIADGMSHREIEKELGLEGDRPIHNLLKRQRRKAAKEVRPQVKYQVIYMNRNRYPVSVMCHFLGVSRSGYYDYIKRLDQPAYDAELAAIIREQQEKWDKTYAAGSGDRWDSNFTNTKIC
jgi:hypothetical protein